MNVHHPRTRLPITSSRPAASGFSLTELLVASSIALVIMGAVASLFSVFSGALSQGEATVEMLGKMRGVAWQLRQDLAGVTVPVRPWTRPEASAGYFELVEGPLRDTTAAADGTATISADTDDILLFTTRGLAGPFVGRFGEQQIESDTAEVAWFCREADTQPVPGTTLYNLYRRQLLVVDYVGQDPGSAAPGNLRFFTNGNCISGLTLPDAQKLYNISLRQNPYNPAVLMPNTLADLTKRENRFGHLPRTYANNPAAPFQDQQFPHDLVLAEDGRLPGLFTFDGTPRAWEDVLLTHVIAFDVRVYDSGARAQPGGTMTRYPGDLGYASGQGAFGAYVDLGWDNGQPVSFGNQFPPPNMTVFQSGGLYVSGPPENVMPFAPYQNPPHRQTHRVYDTWSMHYESNNIDEDGDGLVDEGTDGFDNNENGVVDEIAEFETSPPYPVPLKSIEVRIRCYVPESRQVRQVSIRHSFPQ